MAEQRILAGAVTSKSTNNNRAVEKGKSQGYIKYNLHHNKGKSQSVGYIKDDLHHNKGKSQSVGYIKDDLHHNKGKSQSVGYIKGIVHPFRTGVLSL